MKYFILLCDGMADYKLESLGNRTPMEAAVKPCMDELASKSLCGLVSNVPEGMVPESDTANLAVMSYDPAVYSKGRSPLEAVSMGLNMDSDQTAFRCNVVTISDSASLEDSIMLDHSADEITTDEADKIIKTIDEDLGTEKLEFHTGISYRHCLLWRDAPDFKDFVRPHDILGQRIGEHLPPEPFLSLIRQSREILDNHPINVARIARGLKPANCIWLWSPGKKPTLPSFEEKWGLKASVISAVDLIKGIGLCAGMESIDVEGATGNVNTNYSGKADAVIDAFKRGRDFVYVHVEAPDECGHRAETENKVKAIELIDSKILAPVYEYLRETGDDYRIMVLPDHPTPIAKRTHTMDPVPFFIYNPEESAKGVDKFTEDSCSGTGLYIPHGYNLLDKVIVR